MQYVDGSGRPCFEAASKDASSGRRLDGRMRRILARVARRVAPETVRRDRFGARSEPRRVIARVPSTLRARFRLLQDGGCGGEAERGDSSERSGRQSGCFRTETDRSGGGSPGGWAKHHGRSAPVQGGAVVVSRGGRGDVGGGGADVSPRDGDATTPIATRYPWSGRTLHSRGARRRRRWWRRWWR